MPALAGTAGAMTPLIHASRQMQLTRDLPQADVPNLKYKWAFGVPGVSSMSGQPAVADGQSILWHLVGPSDSPKRRIWLCIMGI